MTDPYRVWSAPSNATADVDLAAVRVTKLGNGIVRFIALKLSGGPRAILWDTVGDGPYSFMAIYMTHISFVFIYIPVIIALLPGVDWGDYAVVRIILAAAIGPAYVSWLLICRALVIELRRQLITPQSDASTSLTSGP